MRNVHLVGSVPLSDADEVFRTTAATVGPMLRRFSDGETGPRSAWVQWQIPVVAEHPQFELTHQGPLNIEQRGNRPYYRLKAGVDPAQLRFGPLGYAAEARASYGRFAALRTAGIIPVGARFLVALPSPLAVFNVLVAPEDRARVEPAYMERFLQEIDDIAAAVPPSDLAIQFDCVLEMLIPEGARKSNIDDSREALIARLALIGDRVPAEAELGYHFCYGDMGHKHSVEPPDLSVAVDMANRLATALHRRLDFLHVPVPRDRDDDAYFAPLEELALPWQSEIYLGLVHLTDGVAGTQRRIAAASRHIGAFGIGTECGFGRRPPETVRELLAIHAACAASG